MLSPTKTSKSEASAFGGVLSALCAELCGVVCVSDAEVCVSDAFDEEADVSGCDSLPSTSLLPAAFEATTWLSAVRNTNSSSTTATAPRLLSRTDVTGLDLTKLNIVVQDGKQVPRTAFGFTPFM